MLNFIELYNQTQAEIELYSAPALNRQRSQYAELLQQIGMPSRKTEGYRNIDLAEPLSVDYGVNVRQLDLPQANRPTACDVRGMNPILCWIINGKIILPKEISEQLITITTQNDQMVNDQMVNDQMVNGKCVNGKLLNDSLVALNAMFAQNGLFISIPDGVQLDRPIQIMNISNAALDLFTAMHHTIVLGKNTKAQVLVCDHAWSQNHYLCSSTTEVYVGEGATYEHYHLEDTSNSMCRFNNLIINQSKSSDTLANLITLRNGTTRNNVFITQNGENCRTELCGMFLGSGHQTADNFTKINHLTTGGHSNELFKYVLDENSKGVFKGELIVAKGAQKTEAYQTNRNILLSRTAKVRTEPQLEIYADDVKCSHGATTGQMDEKALFYMRQRGIPEQEARLLLMNAFVADVINNIRIEALQDRVRQLTDSRLRNDNNSPCTSCKMCK